MAFRIEDSVVRGEIDNRVKGRVNGRIWLQGRPEPLVLELAGNAAPDLAGCRLEFANTKQPFSHSGLDSLASIQRGQIGDLTASRKVRVFDVPLEEALASLDRKEKPPEHLANCLYVEWFSEANGRVVIESTDYQLTISAPEWRLTTEEEAAQARQSAAGMADFLARLDEDVERHRRGQKDPEESSWDEHDYEKFLKESDARTDKYGALLDKYGHSEEAESKIAHEMGWDQELTEEETEEERRRIEEMNAACEEALNEPEPEPDPHREGIDWIRTEDGDLAHPLQHRCFESAVKFWRQIDGLGLKKTADKDLEQFVFEFQTTAAKLAGALNPVARREGVVEDAFSVACLKRALDHLHKSQAGLERLGPKRLVPRGLVVEARRELFEIREGILKLMSVFRGRENES